MWASFPHGQCPDRDLKELFVVRKKKKNPLMSFKKNKSLTCVFIMVRMVVYHVVVVGIVCRFVG
jgi:hypothetical protein